MVLSDKIMIAISGILVILLIGVSVLLWSKSSELGKVKTTNTDLTSLLASKTQESAQLKQSLKDADELTKKLAAQEKLSKEQSAIEVAKIQAELTDAKKELEDLLSLKPRGETTCEQVENLTSDLVNERIRKLQK